MSSGISRLEVRNDSSPEPIAIVGMACRFPGAPDVDAFWTLLREGRDAVGEIPSRRRSELLRQFKSPAEAEKAHWERGGFLEGIDEIDARFFGIAPREAERIDPQQRLLLETSWEAFEDAGVPLERLRGSSTGVFVGLWTSDYERLLFDGPGPVDFYMTTGTGRYSAAGRLSHAFGLSGPSLVLDTACSSSLVAVHLACQSLSQGECDLAIAGGANVLLDPSITIAYSRAKMLSPEGRCKFGDRDARGYVRSEGAGVVLLKRLGRALEDGDRIRAVIRASAVNHDGESSGSIGRPGVAGQVDALRRAYRRAGVAPSTVSYVEAHGTGTRAGDPVEIEALATVLGEGRDVERPLLLGSVKTNLGHLEAASGIAGLIKTVLSFENELLPKSLHLDEKSPHIHWEDLPLRVVTSPTPWPRGTEARLAGLNSFGISGTNAHLVLEQPPAQRPSADRAAESGVSDLELLPLSARSEKALVALAESYRERLHSNEGPSLREIARTAGVRRTHHGHRLVVTARDRREAAARLSAFMAGTSGDPTEGLFASRRGSRRPPRVAFVFPGQGSQWVGMGSRLLAREPSFRESLERSNEVILAETGWSVLDELRAGEDASRLSRIDVVQPTLFAISIAIAALWRSYGIEPETVVGHSMGEIAAAFVAGVLSLEDAARIVCRRSRLLRRVSGRGAMAMVELSMEEALHALEGYEDRLSVAVSNSERSTVLSGDDEALRAVVGALEARNVFCRFVRVDVASHSPQMDPLAPELLRELEGIAPRRAERSMLSTVTGTSVDGPELGPEYWTRNLREPVRFGGVVAELLASGTDVFVEVSPHPILLPAIEQASGFVEADALSLPSMRRGEDEEDELRLGLARLYARGASIDWTHLYPGTFPPVPLPSYPWQRERFWLDPEARRLPSRASVAGTGDGSLGRRVDGAMHPGTHLWQTAWEGSGAPSPGTLLQLALDAGRALGLASPEIRAVRLTPFARGESAAELQIAVTPWSSASQEIRVFSSRSRRAGAESGWTCRLWGRLGTARIGRVNPLKKPTEPTEPTKIAEPIPLDASDEASDLDLGIRAIVARVAPGGELTRLDALARIGEEPAVSVGVVPGERRAVWLSERGNVVAELRGFRIGEAGPRETGEGLFYRVRWEPATPATSTPSGERRFTLVADEIGVADELAAILRSRGFDVAIVHDAEEIKTNDGHDDSHGPNEGSPLTVVFLGGIGPLGRDPLAPGRVETPGVARLLSLVQSLARHSGTSSPRLFVVSRGTHEVGSRAACGSPEGWPLWGLARVVAQEHPELRCTRVDLGNVDRAELVALVEELLAEEGDEEVALRGAGGAERFCPRLEPFELSAEEGLAARRVALQGAFRFSLGATGELEAWEATRAEPGPGEIELRVRAVCLSPADLVDRPGTGPTRGLGLAASGTVVAVGPQAGSRGESGFRVGDRVVALDASPAGLARSHAIVASKLAAKIPDELDFSSAARLPVPYVSAFYALEHLAHVRAGERVLVLGAGALARAAVDVARLEGAEVTIASETPERWFETPEDPDELVLDRTRVDFVDEALAAGDSGGKRGFDVLIDTEGGAELELLRPFGRHVNLSTMAATDPAAGENVASFRVALPALVEARPDIVAAWLQGTIEEFGRRNGTFSSDDAGRLAEPLESTELGSLSSRMLREERDETVVLGLDAPPSSVRSSTPVRGEGTYLVTGGLGGLGLEVARWLVERGARHLALLGRRGVRPEIEASLEALRAEGAEVLVVQADVSSAEDLERALDAIRRGRPQLRGVVHAAGILDDGILLSLTAARLERVMAPKVQGAWNLSRLCWNDPLDFFISFSSVVSLLGTSGQANYAAANAFLDGLAHYRRARGRAGLSIHWAPWASVGLAARLGGDAHLERRGVGALRPEEGLGALEKLLSLQDPGGEVAVMPFSYDTWVAAHPHQSSSSFFERLRTAKPPRAEVTEVETDPTDRASVRESLASASSPSERRGLVERHLREVVSRVTRIGVDAIEPDEPLKAQGLDSLMGLELRNRLERSLGLRLSATTVWNYPTVRLLGDFLLQQIEAASSPEDEAPSDLVALLQGVSDLAEDDVARMLSETGRHGDGIS